MQDLRFAFRQLLKNPGFTAVAVLTLALGIGANTAIFSFVDQLLIRPLAVERPQELVVLVEQFQDRTGYTFNYPLYRDYRDRADLLTGIAAYQEQSLSLTVAGLTERVRGMIVSENYFELLGVRTALGRLFHAQLDGPTGDPSGVVLSHGLWRRRFAADPQVIGKVIHVNGSAFSVLGVAPAEFNGTIAAYTPDIYVPIWSLPRLRPADPAAASALEARHHMWLNLLGRLLPGATREQAAAQLRALAAQFVTEHPDSTATEIALEDGSQGHNNRLASARLPLLMLQVVVGLLLLIACANLANLMLARAAARTREIAIRISIGASRGRIVRQLLTESVLLAVAGGAAGLLVALWLTDVLAGFRPSDAPSPVRPGLDWRVVLFAFGMSVATGVVFGWLPALQASRPNLLAGLKGGGAQPMFRQGNVRSALAVGQIALSLIVLITAGLCVRSAQNAAAIDPGFQPARVWVGSLDLEAAGKNEAQGRVFFRELLERTRVLPGVEAAALARTVVLSGSRSRISVQRFDGVELPPGPEVNLDYNIVTPDYFRALGMPLLEGRDFAETDSATAPRVAIVNETLARRYWPGQSALGQRIYIPRMVAPPPGANTSSVRSEGEDAYEIIGVVQSGKYHSLTEQPTPMMYWPWAQHYHARMTLHLRSAENSRALFAAVNAIVRTMNPYLPIFNARTLEDQRTGSLFLQRMAASMLSGFGALALALAAVGIYGLMAYSVNCRTREIGVRMALGARVADVLALVLRQGVRLALVGIAIGVLVALAATRVLRSFLHGVSPADPVTFGGLIVILLAVALVACWIPARRAAKIDPMTALRYD